MDLFPKRFKSLKLDKLCVRLDEYVNKRFVRSFQREFKDKVHFCRYQQIIDIDLNYSFYKHKKIYK